MALLSWYQLHISLYHDLTCDSVYGLFGTGTDIFYSLVLWYSPVDMAPPYVLQHTPVENG